MSRHPLQSLTFPKGIPSFFLFVTASLAMGLWGCSDFFHPVESVPTPTEYTFNYWLLQKNYLYEEELGNLNPEGDSVQILYQTLSDPFTRYIPPSKSDDAIININTSIVQGSVGMEYSLDTDEHPILVHHVYPDGPAGKAGIPRWSRLIEANGIDLKGFQSYNTYDSICNYNKTIKLTVIYQGDTLRYQLEKETVYAPTVFLDTLYDTEIITIREFKQTTSDRSNGTYGELKNLLDSLDGNTPRILDLRGNPGGLVSQCVSMADLFVSQGNLSTRTWRQITPDGSVKKKRHTTKASPGHAGEGKPFILLVNGSSASCAEIFTAAVSEGAGIPVVGSTTYGKGIGQNTWSTYDNGLAIITNLEFLTPKGNSYHKAGIQPDYPCDEQSLLRCAVEVLDKLYNSKALSKKSFSKNYAPIEIDSIIIPERKSFGGAILPF